MLGAIDYFCPIKSSSLQPKRVVITGGPGTGKTSVIQALESSGFHCFHEVIRDLTLRARLEETPDIQRTNPLAFVSDPHDFNRRLLEGRMRHFGQASGMARPVVFYDRGLPDVLGYMDYFGQKYGPDYTSACRENRYDKVLLLPPWKAIYISDNERLESFEEAAEIHHYLSATYERYGYQPVPIPEDSVSGRVAHILEELKREGYL